MMPSRRTILIGGGAAVLSGCMLSGRTDGERRTLPAGTRLVLVRHFDRDGEDLSRDGFGRAAALPAVVADIPLDALYTRPTGRNQDSARPLSEARGLPMQFIGASSEDGDVPSQVLDAAGGRSIIWIGNSTNLRPIWEMLGLPGEAPTTYGELVVVEPDRAGRARVTDRRVVPTGR